MVSISVLGHWPGFLRDQLRGKRAGTIQNDHFAELDAKFGRRGRLQWRGE